MAAPVVASTSVGGGLAGTTWSINKPSGVVSGDLITIWIITYDQNALVISSPGSDFKFIGEAFLDSTSDIHVVCYQKIAGASEPSSWSGDLGGGAPYWCTVASRTTGTDSYPFGVLATSSGVSATQNVPAVPISSVDELIQVLKVGFNQAVSSGPSGYTQQVISDTVNVLYSKAVSTTGTVAAQNLTTPLSDFFASISVASKSIWNGPKIVGVTKTSTSAPASGTITIPTGSAAGDLAVIYCAGSLGEATVNGSFTQIGTTQSSSTQHSSCFSKRVLTSGDITTGTLPVVGSAGFNEILHTLIVFHSASGTPEVDTFASVSDGGIAAPTVVTFPTALMSTNGTTAIFATGARPQGTSWTSPSNDLVHDQAYIGTYCKSYVGHIDFETSGYTGTRVITNNVDYAEWTAWTLLIKHPSAPASGTLQKLSTESGLFLTTQANVALDRTNTEPVLFTDNFNRADGALGANWNSDAKWKIQNNKAVYDSTGAQDLMALDGVSLPPDHYIAFDWHVINWPMVGTDNNALFCTLRMDGNPFNGYAVQLWQSQYGQQQVEVIRYNFGNYVDLFYDIYGSYERLQDHHIFLGVKGRDVYVEIDGVLYCKVHDEPTPWQSADGGQPHDGVTADAQVGISEISWIGYGLSTIDNFEAGSFNDGRQFTIFSDSFTAADGTDWNTRTAWKKGWEIDSYPTQPDHGKIVNNRLRIYTGTNPYGNQAAVLRQGSSADSRVGSIATNDFEMTADVVVGSFSDYARLWFTLIEHDNGNGWTSYWASDGYFVNSRSLGWNNPPVDSIGTAPSYSPGDILHFRIKVTPNSCNTRVWKNSETEPTTWNGSVTYYSGPPATGGELGFRVATWTGGEDVYFDLDNINVWCY